MDPPQPVGLHGAELLFRKALATAKESDMVDLHVPKRPIVRPVADPSERHPSKPILQALEDCVASVAQIRRGRGRRLPAGQAFESDRAE
jgi:hypothetical protein